MPPQGLCSHSTPPCHPAHLFEKVGGLPAGFQVAKRLRLEAQVKLFSRALAEARNVLDAPPEIEAHRRGLFLATDEFLERTRHGADAPFETRRHQSREQVE